MLPASLCAAMSQEKYKSARGPRYNPQKGATLSLRYRKDGLRGTMPRLRSSLSTSLASAEQSKRDGRPLKMSCTRLTRLTRIDDGFGVWSSQVADRSFSLPPPCACRGSAPLAHFRPCSMPLAPWYQQQRAQCVIFRGQWEGRDAAHQYLHIRRSGRPPLTYLTFQRAASSILPPLTTSGEC